MYYNMLIDDVVRFLKLIFSFSVKIEIINNQFRLFLELLEGIMIFLIRSG